MISTEPGYGYSHRYPQDQARQSLPLCKNFQGATRFSIVRAVHASAAQVDTYRLRSAYVAGKSTDRGDYASAILDF